MTTGEAIFYLKTDREQKIDAMSSPEVAKKTCTVIAYDMAISALEKQMPAKPVKKNPICYSKSIDGEELYAYDYHCPQCDVKVNSERHHCPCGQALDWSE